MRELTYNEAALEAVAEEMRRDPKIFYMSTDALPPLLKEFGAERIRATPITEAALTGMAIGAAGCGFRPIVDWRQVTFCFVAMDQIVNQAAKIHYMFGGQVTFPILYRASVDLAKEGVSVELVDPRTLVPLDTETIRNSVQKTGRLIIADEAGPTAGFSAEIAAVATEDAATFARLKAPVKRVCALQVPIPYSPVLENAVFPDRHRIIAGIREVLRGGRSAEAA